MPASPGAMHITVIGLSGSSGPGISVMVEVDLVSSESEAASAWVGIKDRQSIKESNRESSFFIMVNDPFFLVC